MAPQAPAVTREFVQKLARNLKARTRADLKHTDLIADIASALGWKPDALMHALKAAEATSGAQIESFPPSHSAGQRIYEGMDQRGVDAALSAGFDLVDVNGHLLWQRRCGGLGNVFVAIAKVGSDTLGSAFTERAWKISIGVWDKTGRKAVPLDLELPLTFPEAIEISYRCAYPGIRGPVVVQPDWGMDEAAIFMRKAFARLFSLDNGETERTEAFLHGDREMEAVALALKVFPPSTWTTEGPSAWNEGALFTLPASIFSEHPEAAPDARAYVQEFRSGIAKAVGCSFGLLMGFKFEPFLENLIEEFAASNHETLSLDRPQPGM
jgi:hypothetical protein